MAQPTPVTPRNNPSHAALHNFHLNVKMFGAVGDGITDDTAAINTTITTANSSGATVFFPAGKYKVTSTIDLSSYALLSLEGGHLGPIGLIPGVHPPAVVIDGTGMASGACFSSDRNGGTANYTIKNIIFNGKDQGFALKNAGVGTFQNCGFSCTTTTSDSAGLFVLNSFWLTFEDCAMQSVNDLKPSVIMRGAAPAPNVNSSSGIFLRCTFLNGGVQFETVNLTPTNGGTGTFNDCVIEASQMAMITFIESGAVGAYTCSGLIALNSQIADAHTSNVPLIRVNSAGCRLHGPVVGGPPALSYGRAIEIDAGIAWGAQLLGMGTMVTNSSGVASATSIGTEGSFEVRKRTGLMWVGTTAATSEHAIPSNAGPFLMTAKDGDAYARFGLDTDGKQYWAPGGADSSAWDTNLYRIAPGALKTDGVLQEQKATPTYSASITPNAAAGPWQTITVTNATAFTINAPTNPPDSTHNQELTIEILNSSGGVMGAVTWNAAFVLVGGAFTNPANTKKRFIEFSWNGASWIETSRAGADY